MSVLDEREALEVLGLPLNSNFDTVKSCYKKLALKNHPDKDSSSGANERFAKINKAFELLSRIHSSHQPIKRDGHRKRQPPPNIFNLMLTLEEIFNGVVKYEEVKRKLVDKYEFIVLEVEVVPGTLTGTNIVLPNKGDILSEDGIAANVIFVVKELEHDQFIRDRFNLIYNFKINVLDTLRVDQSLNIPTIDGDTIQLEMDQLIVSTTEKQIPNRGLPYPKAPNGKRGSLIVKFDIKYDKQDPPIHYKFCVSLEQLYSGCEKRFRINRLTLDNEEEYVEFKIEIKPGTRGGTEFKFPRAGDRKLNVIPSDIIFYIEEKPHPKFRRIDKNDDLMVTEYFAPLELGQRIKIPSLSNNDLEIIVDDDLISQMETIRLFEGEGMPNYDDPKIRGSLKVKMILLENDSIDRSKTVDLELSLETIMNGGTVLKVVKQKIFDDDGNEFVIDSFHKFQIVSGILDGN
ncbi:DnaJ sub B member 5 [Blomia tropicalis]|nr:DnaJ sub B member 5 [Blomia tropicalis]